MTVRRVLDAIRVLRNTQDDRLEKPDPFQKARFERTFRPVDGTATEDCMRFALVIPAALAVLISGCAFPRVVAGANSPAFYARCEVEGAPPEGSMLFASVRLPDCSGPL